MPSSAIDYNRLPISGNQSYIAENFPIIKFLSKEKKKYQMVVDIPNIMEVNHYKYRLSKSFVDSISRLVKIGGYYIEIIDINETPVNYLNFINSSFKRRFKGRVVLLFSNIMVVVYKKGNGEIRLPSSVFQNLDKIISSKVSVRNLFYDWTQLSSHLVSIDSKSSDKFLENCEKIKKDNIATNQFITKYLTNSSGLIDIVDNIINRYIYIQRISNNRIILTGLKQAELYESRSKFVEEMKQLNSLRIFSSYRPQFRIYLNEMLAVRVKSYFSSAVEYEKKREWDRASKLYKAILEIDKNNFEANYRMGFLSITLQNIDDGFLYLNSALKLKKNDIQTLIKMGVLLFSNGQYSKSLEYLKKAEYQHKSTGELYYYMAMCYEKLELIDEAKIYFLKASIASPNDSMIIEGKNRIDRYIKDEQNRWLVPQRKNHIDDENGEDIPIPVNKSARDARLKDDNLNKSQ